jgi:hypothetical protein
MDSNLAQRLTTMEGVGSASFPSTTATPKKGRPVTIRERAGDRAKAAIPHRFPILAWISS